MNNNHEPSMLRHRIWPIRPVDVLMYLILIITAALLVLGIAKSEAIVDRLFGQQTQSITVFPPPATSADQAAEEAARAMETVNLMLDFIQAGAIVLAGVAVVVTGFGVWNNARLREELEGARQLEQDFDQVREQADLASTRIEQVQTAVDEKLREIDAVRQEWEDYREATTRIEEHLIPGMNLILLAQRQINMGNLPEALETLKQAHNADPESALVRYFLGDIMVRQGDLDEGIGHLQAARERLTNFYDVDVAYAYALRMQGDRYGTIEERDIYYAQAKAIFLQVAQERPRLQDISGESAFGALAGLYRREGNLREAIRWYERAREATPQNSYPINNLALCYFALGDTEKARKYFQQSLAMARARQTLVPMDYYSRFDVITARLGLHCLDPQNDPYPDDLMHDDFHDTLELVNAMGISTRPLHTFRTGLERLDPASHPPVEAAIRLLDAEMAHMERS